MRYMRNTERLQGCGNQKGKCGNLEKNSLPLLCQLPSREPKTSGMTLRQTNSTLELNIITNIFGNFYIVEFEFCQFGLEEILILHIISVA